MSSKKHVPECKNCQSKDNAVRNDQYDAYHCTKCKVWIEKQCSDADCGFCVNRPENPPNV